MIRTMLAAALALATLPGLGAQAAGPLDDPPALVVTGQGPASAVLRITDTLVLDLANTTASTAGPYAGIAVIRGRELRGAAVTLPAFTAPGIADPPYVVGKPRLTLPAGVYTLLLLADSSAEVRVPIDRHTDIAVVAGGPSRQRFVNTGGDAYADVTSASGRIQPKLGDSWTLAFARVDPAGVALDLAATLCLPAPDRDCQHRDLRTSVTDDVVTAPVRLVLASYVTASRDVLLDLQAGAWTACEYDLGFLQFS